MPDEGRVSSPLLTWEAGPYSSTRGRAGGIELFSTHYSTDKADISAGQPYVLSCELPGYRKRWKVESAEAGQAKAERLFRKWLDLVAPKGRSPVPDWRLVQRDQCNGRTLSCVNCGAPLGTGHHVLCHGLAKAYKAATAPARERS